MNHRITAWAVLLCCLVTFVALAQPSSVTDDAVPGGAAAQIDTPGGLTAYLEFVRDLESVGLGQLLQGQGSYTVFLPAAPDASPMKKLDSRQRATKRAVLTYHIVAGKITASDLLSRLCSGEGEAELTTLQGSSLRVFMRGTDIVLIDAAGREVRITQADIGLQNAVVHKVDQRLSFL